VDSDRSGKGISFRLRNRLVDFLLRLESRMLIAVGVTLAIVFSELIVLVIGILWSGRPSRELLFAGFITPLIVAFIILVVFVAIIARLKAAETRFAAFMKYMPGVAFLKKSSGEFLYVNETWERTAHMKGKDIYGRSDDGLWPEDIAAQYKANDKTVITRGVPVQFIQPVPQDDGMHNWLVVKFPLFKDSGRVVMIGGIGIDITEREHMERELQETEKRFKLLVDIMNEGTAITDPRGVIRYANEKACSMLGYGAGDLTGRSAFDFLDAENRDIVREELRKRSLGQSSRYEVSWNRRDGGHCPVLMSATPLFDREGAFDGSFVVMTDMTDQKKAEESLRLGNEILNSLEEGVCLVRAEDLVIVYANPKLEEMLGYGRFELIGKHVSAINAPGERPPQDVAEEIRTTLEKEHFWKGEVLNVRKNGTAFWSLVHINEFRHSEFGATYLSLQTDITESKRVREELKNYRYHLEELVAQRTEEISVLNSQLLQSQKLEAVGILAGGVAHEFSNILATIKGAAYLIQKKLSKDSIVMKYADQIVSSIAKANNLSRGLLSFSRQQQISLKPLRFNEAIEKAVRFLGRLIGEHIELTLLATDGDATVMADANQLEQVMVNLATNARDAMPEGGTLTIRTGVMEMDEEFIKQHGFGSPGPYALLSVSDTGMGMDEEVRRRIFQPFFTTKMVGKGSGLGLAVTYGIIKQHDGFIDVTSKPGQGTTFRIYLPAVDVEVTQEQMSDKPAVRPGGETILLAEDDGDARAVMRELLEMTGYTVLVAGNGEEAVGVFAASSQRVQLVIADVRMPKKDGRAVYEEIRAISPATRFLFMSGYTDDDIDSRGIREQGLEFISKAARPDELLVKVREVLDA
jgi:PAS domain S-box-containing protein